MTKPLPYEALVEKIKKLEKENRKLQLDHDELQRLRFAIDSAPIAIGMSDPQGHHFFQNRAFSELFEYNSAEELEENGGGSALCQDPDVAKEKFSTIMAGKLWAGEQQMITKNGNIVFISERADAIKDKKGRIIGLIGIISDITQRKKAEAALMESEEKYRSMMESMVDPVYICSEDLTIEYMNPAMKKRLGRDATGELCHRALHGLDRQCDFCIYDRITDGKTIETEVVSPLDNRTYRITNMPMYHGDGSMSKMTIYRDITDYLGALSKKDRTRSQLQQIRKLNAIGTLAGGIAHDFNNILYPIIGFAEMSLEELPEGHPVKENLEDILEGAKRAGELVNQMLLFSRQKSSEQQPLMLKLLIKETLKLLRASIPANIDIVYDLYDGSDRVLCNASEIHTILVNLCTNACHAMEKTGGILEIRLNKTRPGPHINLPAGDYCCLSVHDTGVGIPEENIHAIFDPYYTTKALGKGSGLGLSVIHGIVNDYKGTIHVHSKPGEGSIFSLYFPIYSEPEISEPLKDDQMLPAGKETILFVDDEKPIIKLAVRVLGKLGYTVVGIESSRTALELFQSDPGRFDLVITDMAMPGMTGTDLAQKLMSLRPDIPIILSTGFSEIVNRELANKIGIKAFINKPMLTKKLASTIRDVLTRSNKE